MKQEEFLKQKIKWFNETHGNLNEEDGIDCQICKNKGLIAYSIKVDEMVYERTKECECVKRRMLLKNAKKSNLGEYLTKRADDFQTFQSWQTQNKKLMVNYCLNENESGTWFVALGQSGSGKTLLCSIIANYCLIKLGKQTMYITWTDFISRLKRDMMSDDVKSVNDYLDEVKKVEMLFIDELLKKYNETDLKYIVEIINYRYANNLQTIITSERNIDDLLNIDEATFGRVIEKARQYVIDIPKDRSKNYRLRFLQGE